MLIWSIKKIGSLSHLLLKEWELKRENLCKVRVIAGHSSYRTKIHQDINHLCSPNSLITLYRNIFMQDNFIAGNVSDLPYL